MTETHHEAPGSGRVLTMSTVAFTLMFATWLMFGKICTAMRRQAYPSEALESLPEPATLVGPYLVLLSAAARGVTGRAFDCQAAAVPLAASDVPASPT